MIKITIEIEQGPKGVATRIYTPPELSATLEEVEMANALLTQLRDGMKKLATDRNGYMVHRSQVKCPRCQMGVAQQEGSAIYNCPACGQAFGGMTR